MDLWNSELDDRLCSARQHRPRPRAGVFVSVQLHPPVAVRPGWHRRSQLQSAMLPARSTPNDDRQTQRALPLAYQVPKRQHRPAVAAWAVRTKFVAVLVQARDAAEVDHAASVGPRQAQGVSLPGVKRMIFAAALALGLGLAVAALTTNADAVAPDCTSTLLRVPSNERYSAVIVGSGQVLCAPVRGRALRVIRRASGVRQGRQRVRALRRRCGRRRR
jgi:hypothetical protein